LNPGVWLFTRLRSGVGGLRLTGDAFVLHQRFAEHRLVLQDLWGGRRSVCIGLDADLKTDKNEMNGHDSNINKLNRRDPRRGGNIGNGSDCLPFLAFILLNLILFGQKRFKIKSYIWCLDNTLFFFFKIIAGQKNLERTGDPKPLNATVCVCTCVCIYLNLHTYDHVIFQFFFCNKFTNISTCLFFSVQMGC